MSAESVDRFAQRDELATAAEKNEADSRAKLVLYKIREFARLKREDVPAVSDDDYRDLVLPTLLCDIWDDLLPPHKDGQPQPSPLTPDVMERLIGDAGTDFEPLYEALARVKIPGTDIHMFAGGGTFTGFGLHDEDNGVPLFYTERRIGEGYADDTDTPAVDGPWTANKPAGMRFLEASGQNPDIGDPKSNAIICKALGVNFGDIHEGGLRAKVPIGPKKELKEVDLGISNVGLSPEALKHLLALLEAKSPESIDRFKDGLYTAAGRVDIIGALVGVAALNGASEEEQQAIATSKWEELIDLATNPGPLPPYCN